MEIKNIILWQTIKVKPSPDFKVVSSTGEPNCTGCSGTLACALNA